MAPARSKRWRCDDCEAPAGRSFKHLRSEEEIDSWTTVCNACFKRRRLVTVRQALDAGYPLCAQRGVRAKFITMTKAFLCESLCPLDSLEANADARDCNQARRDAAALKGDARRAKAVRLRLEAALKQADGLLQGPHVELVKHGTVDDATGIVLHEGYRQACDAFREMRAIIRTECVVRKGETADAALLPFWLRTVGLWAQGALVYVVRDITVGDVTRGAVLERVTARTVACRTMRSLLEACYDARRGLGLMLNVRAPSWTPQRHLFVCTHDTCDSVRILLLHFCRHLGVGAGSALVKEAVRLAMAAESGATAENERRELATWARSFR